jgi:type IV secretory pathway VirB2 component (pilin)
MRAALPLLCVLAIAACTTTNPVEAVARASAKSVVLPIVQQRLPGPQAEAVAVCIIDNANTDEIFSLSRDIGTRAGTTTVQTVATILQRPNTIQCVLGAGLPGLAL